MRRMPSSSSGDKNFATCDTIVLLDKAHLEVKLGVLEGSVSARVFVAEVARNLEVLVDATDHEDLLQLLRGLRQRPELPREVAGRHDEIARAGGIRPDEIGRLDLPEPALDHEV